LPSFASSPQGSFENQKTQTDFLVRNEGDATMLERMRTHSRNWIIYLLFGAIIVVFAINFGPGFDQASAVGCTPRKSYAIRVNGDDIPRQLYQSQWRNFMEQPGIAQYLRSLMGQKQPGNNDLVKNFKNRIADDLIEIALLSQEARRYGILVSDKEVETSLLEDSSFHKNGIFDVERYRLIINNSLGLTTEQYHNFQRMKLQAERMKQVLLASVRLSDREIEKNYYLNNSKVQIGYAELDPVWLKGSITPDAKGIDAFLKKPENEEKIKAVFEKEKKKYQEKVHARHLLLTAPKLMKTADIEAKRKKITGLLDEAKKDPKTFEALIRKHSEGPTREQGGDLGFFDRGDMDKSFEEAAFLLQKPGDLSGVVQNAFGFHIIQLIERKAARSLTDLSVKKEIAHVLLQDSLAKEATLAFGAAFLARLKKGETLAALVAPYAKKDEKKGAAKPTSLPTSMAASKPVQPTTSVAYENELTGKLQEKTTPSFSRDDDFLAGIGSAKDSGDLIRQAFSLTEKEPVPSAAVEAGGKFYVFFLKKRTSPSAKEFEKEKQEFEKRQLEAKRNRVLKTWLDQVRKGASIDKNDAVLSASTSTL